MSLNDIDDFEDFERIFDTAKSDSLATGDWFVPALSNAQEFSRLAKIQQLESGVAYSL